MIGIVIYCHRYCGDISYLAWRLSTLSFQEEQEPPSAPDQQNGDTVSLYVFGENENELALEAEKNNGVIAYSKVAQHHHPDLKPRPFVLEVRLARRGLIVNCPHFVDFLRTPFLYVSCISVSSTWPVY